MDNALIAELAGLLDDIAIPTALGVGPADELGLGGDRLHGLNDHLLGGGKRSGVATEMLAATRAGEGACRATARQTLARCDIEEARKVRHGGKERGDGLLDVGLTALGGRAEEVTVAAPGIRAVQLGMLFEGLVGVARCGLDREQIDADAVAAALLYHGVQLFQAALTVGRVLGDDLALQKIVEAGTEPQTVDAVMRQAVQILVGIIVDIRGKLVDQPLVGGVARRREEAARDTRFDEGGAADLTERQEAPLTAMHLILDIDERAADTLGIGGLHADTVLGHLNAVGLAALGCAVLDDKGDTCGILGDPRKAHKEAEIGIGGFKKPVGIGEGNVDGDAREHHLVGGCLTGIPDGGSFMVDGAQKILKEGLRRLFFEEGIFVYTVTHRGILQNT